MEKRFQIIDEKTLECSVLVVLTPTETAIMDSADLRQQIDSIAKDLHVRWSIETNGNITQACISKLFSPIATSSDAHQLEIIATNFMSAINKLTLPAFEDKKELDEDAEVIAERLEFCKEVRKDMDDTENIRVIGAKLLAGHKDCEFLVVGAGRIGTALLKELLDAYIEKYDRE